MLVVVLVVAVLAAIVAGVIVLRPAGEETPGARPTWSAAPSPAPTSDAAPTGCLGGRNRDNAMVITAQKAAPHTSAGAVEVGAAMLRWLDRSPTPTPDDARAVQGELLASDASQEFADDLVGDPNLSGGLIPDGTPYYLTTIRGVWNVESYSADRVTVSYGLPFVVDGALSVSLAHSDTLTLVWERGSWRYLSGSEARAVEDIFATGSKFTEGC